MITKEELKDWMAESDRKEYAKRLEDFIDKKIKSNALKGENTFLYQHRKARNERTSKNLLPQNME